MNNSVICINIKDYWNLTLYKKYELVPDDGTLIQTHRGGVRLSNSLYRIVDDNGNVRGIEKECFMTIGEWRNSRISKIIDDNI